MTKVKRLKVEESKGLLALLRARFEDNMARHQGVKWVDVEARLGEHPDKLTVLFEMERTGGEPDVVGMDGEQFVFFDCSAETPVGRRSVCYDLAGLESRKSFPPENNAQDMARDMRIQLLTEEQYCRLQELGEFDLKTSSWLETPAETRKLGGAIFGDRRFDRVFIYHNGASSYYKVRGFRGMLLV